MTAGETQRETTPAGARLKQSVRRGARVALAAQIASQLISLLVLATLYRRLSLADYGLFGVVLPVLMLVRNLTTLGLGAAAVQREELSAEASTALFWWNVWIGITTALVTLLAAPVVGWVYGDATAGRITLYLAGASLLASLGTHHLALLERQLNWKALAVSRLAAQAIAGFVAVQLAIRGAGVGSLVAQQYVEVGVTTVCAWWFAGWMPGPPRRHAESLKLLGFGSHFGGAGLFFFLATNVDKLLLGALWKTAGRDAAGYYTQSFNFMMRPVSLLTAPLNSLMLPALARARGEGDAFREVYLSFQRLIAITMSPVGVGLMLTAPEVMHLLGGENWSGAGQTLRLLAPTILVQGFINTASSGLAAVGRADRLFAASVAFAAVMSMACFLVLTGYRESAESVNQLAATYSVTSIALFIPYQIWSCRTLEVRWSAWLRATARPLLSALAMGVCVYFVRAITAPWNVPPKSLEPAWVAASLGVQVATGVVAYVLFAWGECRWLWGQLRRGAMDGV